MKKRLLLFAALFAFSSTIILAQQLTPMVISSSGGFFDNTAGMLSFTTGEMTAIETYSSPAYFLTQGFQQPWDMSTSISPSPETDILYSILPNPSDGYLWIVTKAESSCMIDWKILNVLGKEMLQGKYEHTGHTTIEPIDLTSAPSGSYFISITIKEQWSQPSSPLVNKIQIIR